MKIWIKRKWSIIGHQVHGWLIAQMGDHEFLDAARDPGIWELAKYKMAPIGGFTMEIGMAVLKQLAMEKLGMENPQTLATTWVTI